MIQGKWLGKYEYNMKSLQKSIGSPYTNFELDIIPLDDERFIGKVTDDIKTGGAEGVGEISGFVTESKVEFVKRMPTLTVRGSQSKTVFKNIKHRDIFYNGVLSSDCKTIKGTWRIKFGIVFIGLCPMILIPTKGTFSMSLSDAE